MCGIVGYFSKNPSMEDAFDLFKLIRQSKIRGVHSYGYSYLSGGKIVTRKFFQNEFRDIKIPTSNFFIYHNRYSTSGDFHNHENNQPIHIDNSSLCFNGVIDMGTKEEMEERWSIKMETHNDGEVLLKVSEFNPKAMLELVSRVGSFSGLLLQDRTLYAFTNGMRPMWIYVRGESMFLASTKDIFIRALGDVEPFQVPANKLLKWEL